MQTTAYESGARSEMSLQIGDLGRCLGRMASAHRGLNAIYLPSTLDPRIAEATVREANSRYVIPPNETGPFAILIDDATDERPQDIPVVTRSEAIRYRQDNRLAVIPATSVDIASFDGTFREVVGPGFPVTTQPHFDTSDLAREAAGLLNECYGNVQGFDLPRTAHLLQICMDDVAELLAEERDGAASWTREWFELVDRALGTLATLPDYYAQQEAAISYQEMLESNVWSTFGLPRPTATQRRENAAQYIQTLNERWASEDSIALTTRELAISGRHGAAELARCQTAGWDGLDESIVREGGVLTGLQSFLASSPERVAAFSQIDRDIFFGQDDGDASPVVRTADGIDASLATEARVQTPVLSSTLEEGRIVSEPFMLDVPAIQTPPDSVVAGSRLAVEAESPRSAKVEQCSSPGLAGANVRLTLSVSVPIRKALRLQKVRLRVNVPVNDPLHGYLRQRTIDVFVVPPVDAAAILAPWSDSKRSRLSAPLYEGPEEVSDESSRVAGEDVATYMVELKPSKSYRVAFHAPHGDPRVSTLQLQPSERQGWWFGDIPADIPAEIVDRGSTWQFEAAAQSTAPQSLLVSATLGVNVDASDPKTDTVLSLRGQLETMLANNVEDRSFLEGLGHVALPTDNAVHVESLKLSENGLVRKVPLLVPSQLENKWEAAAPIATAPTDWLSARDEFVVAWQDCLAELEPPLTESSGGSVNWPSKRSTLRLGKRSSLVPRMLRAYTRMVQSSQDADPLIRFASTFPFSASGWRILPSSADCEAVLLSPWHPLRLAWLASVEETLSASQRAHALVGTLEGWKFPFVAPSPLTHGRMIAVPIDGGQDDIFAAWGLMLPLAFGDMKPVKAPSHMAGLAMPGSSASGLTGSAADAAVRDFRRVNGHLSSVTIDLASSSPSQRMVELDESILSAARLWSTGPSPVIGIDIRDSLNRHGDLPRREVTDLLRDGLATSISWSRYRPRAGRPVRSNLRLLQDSGVKLSQDVDSGDRRGIIGNVPLRRFEGPADVDATKAVLQPSVNGSTPFAEALRAVEERRASAPRVLVGLHLSQLLDDHADWSISGDSFVSASILATSLARQAEAGQPRLMLWEWRPPFLDPDKGSALNRRPYASVMRIGHQLTARISEHIARVDNQSSVKANDVFATLGAQGIGLSSLLTMGGHHASGALGFYLTLRMIELAKPASACIQAVMPIDSCRSFLDVLAPDSRSSETRRQADLLVIRATPQSVCLIPVEIKMYGLDGSSPESLPSPGRRFDEALDQLKSTTTLLSRLQDERRQLEEEGRTHDKALWDNALATLLEAALRLNPTANDDVNLVVDTLQSIADGTYDLAIGRPLITFYQHDPDDPGDHRTYAVGDVTAPLSSPTYGALAARPNAALSAVAPGEPPAAAEQLIRDWSSVVQWAHDNSTGHTRPPSLSDDGATPVSDDSSSELEQPTINTEAVASPPRVDRQTPTSTVNVPRNPAHGPDVQRASVPGGPLKHSDESSTPTSDHEGTHGSGEPEPSSVSEPPTGTGPGSEAPIHEPAEGVHQAPTALRFPAEDGVRFQLGSFSDTIGNIQAEYWPGNTSTTQLNMGIVGDLGTGKTQLLKALMFNLRRTSRATQPRAINGLVFDYKRDFQDTGFVTSAGAKVWAPHRIPLNVLELHERYSRPAAYKRAASFASMLARIYSGIGPVQRSKLINVILELFTENPDSAPTIRQVLNRYQEDGTADSVSAILEGFVLSEIFAEDSGELISLEEAMDDCILVLDLNSFGADHKTKNALVALFLDMFYESMKRSTKPPFSTSNDGTTIRQVASYLLVDEASNIMEYDFPVLESLLKEGREFGVGTILSSQYLSHFKSKNMDFAESLSTWFVHKVPNVTPTQLSSLGIVGTAQSMADRIKKLPVHESLYKSDLSEARFIRETPFWQLVKTEATHTS